MMKSLSLLALVAGAVAQKPARSVFIKNQISFSFKKTWFCPSFFCILRVWTNTDSKVNNWSKNWIESKRNQRERQDMLVQDNFSRIGADGKPLLNRPDIEECMKSESLADLKILIEQSRGRLIIWKLEWSVMTNGNGWLMPFLLKLSLLRKSFPSLLLKSKTLVLINSRTCPLSGKSHMKIGNHNYFLSWREPWHKFEVLWKYSQQQVEKCTALAGLGLVQRT